MGWETDPIQLLATPAADWIDGNAAYVAGRIKAELENLPNQVVESVTVTSLTCGRGHSKTTTVAPAQCEADLTVVGNGNACGGADIDSTFGGEYPDGHASGSLLGYGTGITTAFTGTGMLHSDSDMQSYNSGGAASTLNTDADGLSAQSGHYLIEGDCLNFQVSFTGDQNAGVQNLLTVNYAGCNYDGCAPHYSGLTNGENVGTAATRLAVYVEDVTAYVSSGSNLRMHEESAICSEHGLCDTTTGLCTCFSGYYDEDCTQQTVLV